MPFLWDNDAFPNNPEIMKLRFKRVIFGSSSSQFLLNGTVEKLGSKYETVDPEFARKVKKHFYVDDSNTGVMPRSELYHNMKSRFSEAGLN